MATELEVVGPFPIPFKNKSGSVKKIFSENTKEFLAEEKFLSIANKNGCYVFALQASRGFKVWYVGKATKTMRQECLSDHKLKRYNEVLFEGYKGTPVLFFIVPGGGKKKVPSREIDNLETTLIHAALKKNPELSNIQKTNLPKWSIKGVVRGGSGKATKSATSFKTMMDL